MKVAILAGGAGSRLAEETQTISEPMVEIGGKPPLAYHASLRALRVQEFRHCLGL